MTVNVERSKITLGWIKGTRRSGLCYTMGFDHLEEILKTGRLPSSTIWKLKPGEFVERFLITEEGITVFIDKKE